MGRYLYLVIGMMALTGCATTKHTNTPVVSGLDVLIAQETATYLAPVTQVQGRIDQFIETHPKANDRHEINYLIQSIRESKLTFMRNGSEYNGSQASRWLRWKMYHKQFRKKPIKTAEDFIKRVSTRSKKTGQYYEVMVEGKSMRLHELLKNELRALQKRQVEETLEDAVSEESIAQITSESQEISTPVVLPPVAPTP